MYSTVDMYSTAEYHNPQQTLREQHDQNHYPIPSLAAGVAFSFSGLQHTSYVSVSLPIFHLLTRQSS